ncbi:tRNA-dependent cyclodipeptide synthase [Pseudomonas aeruginosa]
MLSGRQPENRNFTPNRFHSMVEWAARRFEKCSILIGDHIHRITLQSTRDMPEEDARREAVRLGDAFMEESRLIVDAYRHATDFQYITCSEIQASTECKDFYSSLRNYFLEHSDSEIRWKSLEETTTGIIGRS